MNTAKRVLDKCLGKNSESGLNQEAFVRSISSFMKKGSFETDDDWKDMLMNQGFNEETAKKIVHKAKLKNKYGE